jgi:dihydroneopterin aldolase
MTNTLFVPETAFADFEATTLFVRGLQIEAEIGVHPHERGRSQTLLLDLDIVVAPVRTDRISATFVYDKVLGLVNAVTAAGHIDLVETFAKLIGQALLANEARNDTGHEALCPSASRIGSRRRTSVEASPSRPTLDHGLDLKSLLPFGQCSCFF